MSTYNYILELFTLSPEDPIMILICMGLFYVFWQGLQRHFFDRYLPLYEARMQATDGNLDVAEKTSRQAEEMRKETEALLQESRGVALARREAELSEAKKLHDERFNRSEAEIMSKIKEARIKVEEEAGRVREQLKTKLPEFVDNAVQSLVN